MLKIYKYTMGFDEIKQTVKEEDLSLLTLESDEGMGVLVGLLHSSGITTGLVVVHESITDEENQFSAKVYDIELDEVKDVFLTPELDFYLPHVEIPVSVPICPCNIKDAGYEITVEFQDESKIINKAVCDGCGNVYGLEYELKKVVQLPKDDIK